MDEGIVLMELAIQATDLFAKTISSTFLTFWSKMRSERYTTRLQFSSFLCREFHMLPTRIVTKCAVVLTSVVLAGVSASGQEAGPHVSDINGSWFGVTSLGLVFDKLVAQTN